MYIAIASAADQSVCPRGYSLKVTAAFPCLLFKKENVYAGMFPFPIGDAERMKKQKAWFSSHFCSHFLSQEQPCSLKLPGSLLHPGGSSH